MRGAWIVVLALAGCGRAEAPKRQPTMFESASIDLPAETAALPATPAGKLVTDNCTACHSLEMITQQPAMDAKHWATTVKKMREAYKAGIEPGDDAQVAEALVSLQRTGG